MFYPRYRMVAKPYKILQNPEKQKDVLEGLERGFALKSWKKCQKQDDLEKSSILRFSLISCCFFSHPFVWCLDSTVDINSIA